MDNKLNFALTTKINKLCKGGRHQ